MNSKPVLILSLAANLVLLGAVSYLVTIRPDSATVAKHESAAALASAAAAKTQKEPTTEATSAAATNRVVQVDWRNVESEDYRKYIANLRSIGCPEETIRDIITADVNKLFAQRRREALSGGRKFEYWKASGNPFLAAMNSERIEKQSELDKEKRALLRELLGVEPDPEPRNMFTGMFETMLDFLPPEKEGKIMQYLQDAQVKMMKEFKGGGDTEDAKKMQKMQKEMENELAQMLTPEEFHAFQLRLSQTATTMRMTLASFDPSEDEFKKIFAVKKKFDDDYPMLGAANESKEEKEKRKAAQQDANNQLKSILGDDRYAEYELSQDWSYRTIYQVADRNGLGKETANKVYDMKKVAEEEAKKLRNDKSFTPEQRAKALQDIRTETENSVRAALGDKGWKSYENQAWWLNGISPKKETTQ